MLQGLGNLLGSQGGYNQASLGGAQNQSPLGLLGGLAGMGNTNQGLLGNLGGLGGALGGLGGAPSNPIAGLLSGGLRCNQNEQRLMQEKEQRNLLKKYLIQQTGDPIQSALISSTIPGKGALDDFDVGLGSRSSILRTLGIQNQPAQSGLFGNTNNNLLGNLGTLGSLASLAGGNNSSLRNLSTVGNLAKIASSNTNNTGLLSSLVSMASTPNNNQNILSSLGGLGTGLLGSGNQSGGLLGSIQSGVNTLNTINKVNNAINSVSGLLA